MALIKSFVFFDSTSTAATSNYFGVPSDCGAMQIEVSQISSGSFSLSFEGCADLDLPDTYHTLKCVNMGTFETTQNITAPGIYLVVCTGLFKIRGKLSAASQAGKIKVLGNAVG